MSFQIYAIKKLDARSVPHFPVGTKSFATEVLALSAAIKAGYSCNVYTHLVVKSGILK